ncbi:MAG: hypothetical protein KJ826_16670 [Proteobacteria bacterium]|nr:hypothetical protein [Pseudomonadota bacterium]
MGKLTKQQIIILSITVIVALYGIYDFFIAPHAKSVSLNMKNESTQLEAFLTDITAKITKGPITAADNYTISRAEAEWKQDPFYNKKSLLDWIKFNKHEAKSDLKSEPIFNYSGYIGMGNKKMAIINGIEYESGDNLETEGYVVEKIYPDKAIIINKKSMSRFEVSLQD